MFAWTDRQMDRYMDGQCENSIPRVVKLSNFFTCPRTSKWSKSTCPTKIYLLENLYLYSSFLSKKTYVVGTQQKHLGEVLLMSTHNWGASIEYPQHMFWMKKCLRPKIKKCVFQVTQPCLIFHHRPLSFLRILWESAHSAILFSY